MTARLRQSAQDALRPLTVDWLDAVMAVEQRAYAFPWTRGNFIDSLAAGYPSELLVDPQRRLVGYFVGMHGVDEMHLLNITVAPEHQGRGHARTLLNALVAHSRAASAHKVWLEVRQSNAHAQAVYRHFGFQNIGLRRGYYPAALGQREDAVVMAMRLTEDSP